MNAADVRKARRARVDQAFEDLAKVLKAHAPEVDTVTELAPLKRLVASQLRDRAE